MVLSFLQPPVISFKRDKNIGNFLVTSSFQTNYQPGLTFKCARLRCKTCPFIHNVEKMSGPRRAIKITDHFACTFANVIYYITYTCCKKLYIGETERLLGDQFREHLRDVERNDKDASEPVSIQFNLPNHSKQHVGICGLSLHLSSSESRKTPDKKLSSKSAPLIPTVSTRAFHSISLFLFSRHRIPTSSVAPFSAYKPTHNPQFLQSL